MIKSPRPLVWAEEGGYGRKLLQHPLLALSKEIREDCILGYYHFNRFGICFDLIMGKFSMSDLKYAARLLGPDLLRALFTRNIPSSPLFNGMQFDHVHDHITPRLLIQVRGFSANMTLASFVQWTAMFFDGPLALENSYDVTPWKQKHMEPSQNECNNTNWEFDWEWEEKCEDAKHTETILRGL